MSSSFGKIEHFFVLMLENRSFDHMLGFAGLNGIDPTGQPTSAIDLRGLTLRKVFQAMGMWSVSSVSNMAGDTSSNGLPILVGFLLWSTRNIARTHLINRGR
jgi:phospholipase C